MGRMSTGMKIGILTAGGDCPGINAAIRGVGKTAIVKYGMKLVGISDGFTGLINKEYRELSDMIADRDFGKMVALKNNEIESMPLEEVSGRLKLIEPDNPLILQAKNMGTSFGV